MKPNFREVTSEDEVLRLVLIGLPYSGVQEVAELLRQNYGCVVQVADFELKAEKMQPEKFVRKICFQHFRETPKAVMIMNRYFPAVLRELKKRNYVNVVQVQSPFRSRYNRYIKAHGLEANMETVSKFMIIDEQFQTKDFQECEEFVRVKLSYKNGLEQLLQQVKSKQKDIIRYFRPSWDQYFMKMADIARRRSNCMKTSVGAVIVNDQNRVVSTGYNGTPKGLPSCYRMGCERCNSNEGKKLDQCLCLHAQESALIEVGIGKTAGCRLYTTYYPCFSCAKIIKQAGIKRIYYMDEYEKQDSGKPFIKEYFDKNDVIKINVDNLYY